MKKSPTVIWIIGLASIVFTAPQTTDRCKVESSVPCYPGNCNLCYCLGPQNYGVNAPVSPKTCNGDVKVSLAGFYWNAHQDGMQFAIDNSVVNPGDTNPEAMTIQQLNNLIEAEYKSPHFGWDFGFKFGLGYTSARDGWDIGALWTWYRGKASSNLQADIDSNHTLLPLWSAFTPAQGFQLFATSIEARWTLELNLVDLELGRHFWISQYVSLRPHAGLRIAFINQKFHIQHQGGSWDAFGTVTTALVQPDLNNELILKNDYKGVGLRAGLDSTWNLGCGFGMYGNFATSLVYGRFSLRNREDNHTAVAPNTKTQILETTNSFRASRQMLDFALGIQWSALVIDCSYGLTVMLGWENHLFLHHNLFRAINRNGASQLPVSGTTFPNNNGQNTFIRRSGDLNTQGWTLTLKFEY